MRHIEDIVYKKLAEFIRQAEDSGWYSWEYDNYSAGVLVEIEFEREYTGVEFMGDRESRLKPTLLWFKVEDFCCYDDEDNEIPTDFDPAKIPV